MTTFQTSLLVLAIALVAVVAYRQHRLRKSGRSVTGLPVGPHGRAEQIVASTTPSLPEGFRVMDGDSEVFSMQLLDDDQSTVLAASRMVDAPSDVVNVLSAFTQAMPSVATAAQVQSKRLMEVVIKGDLVRASDGSGWRAFSIGKNGIRENARLFEAVGTKGLAIASAAWQVLAVVVGQKYMADISRQLNSIDEKIDRIAAFLDQQRSARIKAAYKYIRAAYEELHERSPSQQVLNQLEDIWVQLDEISTHIYMEVDATFEKEQRTGTGSSEEYESACARLESLEKSILALDACIQTRLACWYLGWLHPEGKRFLRKAKDIQEDLKKFWRIREGVAAVAVDDMKAINAFWNTSETLQERRADVARRARALIDKLEQLKQTQFAAAMQIFRAVDESERPIKLLATIENGEVVAAYLPATHLTPELASLRAAQAQVLAGGRSS